MFAVELDFHFICPRCGFPKGCSIPILRARHGTDWPPGGWPPVAGRLPVNRCSQPARPPAAASQPSPDQLSQPSLDQPPGRPASHPAGRRAAGHPAASQPAAQPRGQPASSHPAPPVASQTENSPAAGCGHQAMEENAQLNSKLNNFKEFNEKSNKLFRIVAFAVELRVFLHCLVATACGW